MKATNVMMKEPTIKEIKEILRYYGNEYMLGENGFRNFSFRDKHPEELVLTQSCTGEGITYWYVTVISFDGTGEDIEMYRQYVDFARDEKGKLYVLRDGLTNYYPCPEEVERDYIEELLKELGEEWRLEED